MIARILGPTAVAIAATEALNMHIFIEQTPPVVYLNGALLLVAGLAIVQAHNRWAWEWALLVTLTGWTAVALGLWRMIAPEAAQAKEGAMTSAIFVALGVLGGVLSFQGYRKATAAAPGCEGDV